MKNILAVVDFQEINVDKHENKCSTYQFWETVTLTVTITILKGIKCHFHFERTQLRINRYCSKWSTVLREVPKREHRTGETVHNRQVGVRARELPLKRTQTDEALSGTAGR